MTEVEQRPETLEEFSTLHWNTVSRIASRLARQHGTVDAEDLVQAIWEKAIERFDGSLKGVDQQTAEKYLTRYGRDALNQESLDYMYFSGKYIYSPREVRTKLATCAWSELHECPDVEARVDLRGAFERLPPKQRLAVFKRYGMKEPASSMSSAEKRNEERGVDAITHYLNRGVRATPANLDDSTVREEVEHDLIPLGQFRGQHWGADSEYGGNL